MGPMDVFNSLPPDQQKQVVDLGLKATEKLSNGIFKVLGYRFEAKHMKAMAEAEAYKIKALADAKSYEINTIGEAIRNNQDLPMAFNNGDTSLSIDTTNTEQLIQRSNYRLQYQQARKEHNIESVIGKTVLELGDSSLDSVEEIDPDWLTRFFETVEDISDEQVQTLWARILAGEVLKPRTYTYRLLSVLRNISKNELGIILKIAPLVCGDVILNEHEAFKLKEITWQDISILEDMGIIKDGSLQIRGLELASGETKIFMQTSKYAFVFTNTGENYINHMIDVLDITETGKKIFGLANIELNMGLIKKSLEKLFAQYNELTIFASEITGKTNDRIFVSNKHLFDIDKKK
ncbi:MAG: DUF2806 domain-containing protein [Treponema sp.]|nr:DUF2806 domain-containing protein [Treponema sp.]